MLNSTHNERIDQALSELIAHLNTYFPNRIRCCYVNGSYADQSGVVTSDVDFLLIFKGKLADGQENIQIAEIARKYGALHSLELDIEISDELTLTANGANPSLKMASLLLSGEDIRAEVPLVSLIAWTRDRMHSSYWRTVHLCQRPPVISYPLQYPNPTAEFYGYTTRTVRLSNGQEVASTRDLIRLVGWSATGIIAYKGGRYVARKGDCHKIYQACFDDEWGQFLQDVYEQCRGKWNYLVPTDPQEREALRSICARTLTFENHFLLIYKEFLLAELHSTDEQGISFALWILKQMTFQDEEVKDAINALISKRTV